VIISANPIARGLKKVSVLSFEQLGEEAVDLIGTMLRGAGCDWQAPAWQMQTSTEKSISETSPGRCQPPQLFL
jgi:hypothetical protein